MDRLKLNYRFHNPNPTNEELTRALLRVCIDANEKKAERAIRESAIRERAMRPCTVGEKPTTDELTRSLVGKSASENGT